MAEVIRSAVARCGTPSGHSRHQRHGEKPCNACALAKARYDARWRSAEARTQRSRINAQAQKRALLTLSWRYPDEYRQLYESIKADLQMSISPVEGGDTSP
jgi:hypothetical protein